MGTAFDPVLYSLMLVVFTVSPLASSWHDVPNSVPVWWNIYGHPIYYLPRWFGFTLLFLFLPFLMVVITCILQFRSCQSHLSDEYDSVGLLIGGQATFTFFLSTILRNAYVSQSGDISPCHMVANVAFCLMIWPGIFFPCIPPNSSIGILTPWTVRSDHNWTKTHTHAAWILVINGLVLLICAFYVPTGVPLLLVTLVLWVGSYLYLVIYSFIVYKRSEISGEYSAFP
ncbi:hypothetical protein R1sor_003578 [Riccia sorocarpa]|uniref:Uncharacterized protein n=1 Tax=Riccia sorocarpa TaxID=122646 RepID=A0ABD3H634_9MARC